MQFIDLKAQYRLIQADVNQRIQTLLEHGQYIMGPEVRELEATLAEYVGVEHCIGCSSGTDALLMAMMALGIGPGDEVITTPFTFIATGETIALLGAVPVFVDIDPQTYNLDPNLIEAAITLNTRAIMPVSLYGQCADMDVINEIAARHGLAVIEDGAQSFGASYKGRMSCGLSDIGCTSFFPSKPLGCYGDGGACFTDDAELATTLREIRDHGQDRRYHHPRLGINGRLDGIQAAVLLAKFEQFKKEVALRAEIGGRYTRLINEQCPGVTTPHLTEGNTSVYAQYTIQVDDRDQLQKQLAELEIPTAIHYPVPLNAQPVFADCGQPEETPESLKLSQRVISLPMHPYLSEEDQETIVTALQAVLT
ncbi:DegT/DnrJ/EryC1/StrS family aminotransferase [Candidatus Endoriftia persephonae]|jgi:UDP-2-acetamido-2-deoxy-ribo-hexuluronate aminotransferase|uniref:DegT/DnrJ/EryC1/StrS aminotransferase n=2 Tax=Gammaproteobacteria TaxID=1236 RepID=G2FH55_9GAMM|nr:DegT/DnrJ/EryC1/StrS family aminotransferase [Candidatus Endoriftia persephone]EGW53869.1 DegT/DnrJ/EryC1/StrS aminotransferase [endosymbiont of Tevnia jerichonana (vent Tica)]USF87718.1 DegT/DnrJ/EryC1/StrS family aminotransferase [Candidatus Endoriftia persephone]